MQKLNHPKLWAIIRQSGSDTVDPAQADAALDEFYLELTDYCRQEKDPRERIRTLRLDRSRLIIAEELSRNGAGEKCGRTCGCRPSRYSH
jgi:hypothetical protein